MTSKYATPFLRAPNTTIAVRSEPPRLAPGTTNRLDRLLAGRRVGVLPGSDLEPRFWLAYCGAEVRDLTWLNDPAALELTFHAKTNILFGLAATAPFPTTGDRRFTPATKSRIPANDVYVPLVQLRDSTGRIHGDAVVYVEHREAPLRPGKTVYSWMRTPEAFGTQDFLLSLYQFVSTRSKPVQPK